MIKSHNDSIDIEYAKQIGNSLFNQTHLLKNEDYVLITESDNYDLDRRFTGKTIVVIPDWVVVLIKNGRIK